MSNATDRPLWCDDAGLRIWRSPDSDFYADEIRNAPGVYTDDVLAGIAAGGFNAVWIRGKLRDLSRSTVLPELNRAEAGERLDALREVIERGRRHGVQVFLFFNEPLGVSVDDPFWKKYPELAGQRHRDFDVDHDVFSLCTSTEPVKAYFREATAALFREAAGLGGVILITASEYHSHCWSHCDRRGLFDDGMTENPPEVDCPRCRKREPSEVVSELVTAWRDGAAQCSPVPRVLCWNWSWSWWYDEPQAEVIRALPEGVALQLDFERGTQVVRDGRTLPVDEYSLSVVGPSERFLRSREVARERDMPVTAKMQLGTTHEIATVPNLPLIDRLHGKLVGLTRQGVTGIMGTWNFGCTLTLNTYAVKLYCEDPDRYEDATVFTDELARRYLGAQDTAGVRAAWKAFGEAFDHYPFSVTFLYVACVNYAPAYPLRLRYEAKPLGGAWVEHEWGDRLEDSLTTGYSVLETAEALDAIAARWREGLDLFIEALGPGAGDGPHRRHRAEELSCARMIGLQMRSAANAYRFHAWRLDRMRELGLQAPCDVSLDERGRAILIAERDTAHRARDLCLADARLGRHQECQATFYDAQMIGRKIEGLDALIG